MQKKSLIATILALQLEYLEKQKHKSENNLKPSSYLPPDNCRYCKKSGGCKRNCPAVKRKV